MRQISLSGTWEFRFDGEPEWRTIPVPGCWEMLDVPKHVAGPAWYRTRFELPGDFGGDRLWLRCDAVSYACTVSVNGREVGSHLGLWDAFVVEITQAVDAHGPNEVLMRVEKPASLSAGPASPALPGAYPLKETLAGFLPYVWGHIFGGIWQDVTLFGTGRVVFEHVHVQGDADGVVGVDITTSAPGEISLAILDPDGQLVFEATEGCEGQTNISTTLPRPRPWSPRSPALYTARLRLADGDERTVRFGLRRLEAWGSMLTLNRQPIYPRMALSWGWYPHSLHSNPGPEHVRAELEKLRSLGYNGVKLCLWFPPQYFFALADELGMLLWVELPMWLPTPSDFFRRQVPVEYARLVLLAHNHPSVMLYTLGCELNAEVGADILGPVYALVRSLAGNALIRDNSGSGEAYGGLLDEWAEFYDYHFYSDLQFFRNLLDYFTPRWRTPMPWLFGEYCDLDTFRDPRKLPTAYGGAKPWWTLADPRRNPQGARWQFDIVEQEARLRENGWWERGAELERISEQQALLHRKWTIELTRTYREVSGYVVTGEVDTPISTAGMWDDLGRLKFDPARFRAFNQDLVLLVGWDKRRAWVAGGDRAAPWDTWSYTSEAKIRPHLLVSHYGAARGPAYVTWSVTFPGEAPFAQGATTTSCEIVPGDVRELAIAAFTAPVVAAPRRATLRAAVRIGDETAENTWSLWLFPRDAWSGIGPLALVDPSSRLSDFPALGGALVDNLQSARVAIATAWTREVETFVARGGAAMLLQPGAGPPGPVPTIEMPYWREAIKILDPHPAWGDFPHDGWADLQFFGCAPDYALDTSALKGEVAPIMRRLDARTMAINDYAVEIPWGAGRLIVSTLRFEGGLGEQPAGVSRNTAAAYLLSCWARYLLSSFILHHYCKEGIR
jgi:hypothetical protein